MTNKVKITFKSDETDYYINYNKLNFKINKQNKKLVGRELYEVFYKADKVKKIFELELDETLSANKEAKVVYDYIKQIFDGINLKILDSRLTEVEDVL